MDGHEAPQRVTLQRARELAVSYAARAENERVAAPAALGRVLAVPVFARIASPHFRVSAMDGIAVRSAESTAATPDHPLLLREWIADPTTADGFVCHVIDTGNALPHWADAVVRLEDTRRTADGFEIRAPVSAGRDVRRAGEDIDAGALVLGRGHRIHAHDIGALIATGIADVLVRRLPRIAAIATGSEVIEPLAPDAIPEPGQVIEFNSRVLAAYAHEWGAQVEYFGQARDDEDRLREQIRRAVASCDAACVIAGSSGGRKDLSVAALGACGQIVFRGVDVIPGRPAALGVVDGKPVFVVPGYPVAAVVIYRELVQPWIEASLGRRHPAPRTLRAEVRRKISSRLGAEELLRVCLASHHDRLVVAPLPRGAGSISSLVRAHGLLRIGPRTEGYDAGAAVDVELLDCDFDARGTVIVAGPPDPFSAALEDTLARAGMPLRFSHLGHAEHDVLSALGAGEAHLAVLSAACHEPPPRALRFALHDAAGTPLRHLVLASSHKTEELRSALMSRNFIDALRELGEPVATVAETSQP